MQSPHVRYLHSLLVSVRCFGFFFFFLFFFVVDLEDSDAAAQLAAAESSDEFAFGIDAHHVTGVERLIVPICINLKKA